MGDVTLILMPAGTVRYRTTKSSLSDILTVSDAILVKYAPPPRLSWLTPATKHPTTDVCYATEAAAPPITITKSGGTPRNFSRAAVPPSADTLMDLVQGSRVPMPDKCLCSNNDGNA